MSYLVSKEESKEENVYMVEPVELSSESDPDDLDDLDDIERMDDHGQDIDQLDSLIKTTKNKEEDTFRYQPTSSIKESYVNQPKDISRLVVVDDFVRNFLSRNAMKRTLEVFQQEWQEIKHRTNGKIQNQQQVPDAYIENQTLKQQIEVLKGQLDKAIIVAEKAKSTYDKLLKERDFHKMHHQRVQQQKKKLNGDIQKLKNLHIQYETKYDDLTEKYTHAMKEKMLIKLERDRLKARVQVQKPTAIPPIEQQTQQIKTSTITTKKFTPFPDDQRPNPYQSQTFQPYAYKQLSLFKSYAGHSKAITRLAFHPKKNIIGTASDDFTWKIWTVPSGQLIMSGEGHKDWVSGISFHPKGLHIVTSSGDSTVKVWDFANTTCAQTFKDHIQPVFNVIVHDTGDFVATASMDHTSKLLDLNVSKCRQTFRGHVDSVNNVSFQPYSNILCTSSADKTLSLWDIRTGLCVQTFYGHLNALTHAEFNLKGDMLVSSDQDGIVKLWDVRMTSEKNQFDTGPFSANSATLDRSSSYVAVPSDEGLIKLFDVNSGKLQSSLKGHEDAVHDVVFDFNSRMLISCGSDCYFRIWQ